MNVIIVVRYTEYECQRQEFQLQLTKRLELEPSQDRIQLDIGISRQLYAAKQKTDWPHAAFSGLVC